MGKGEIITLLTSAAILLSWNYEEQKAQKIHQAKNFETTPVSDENSNRVLRILQ